MIIWTQYMLPQMNTTFCFPISNIAVMLWDSKQILSIIWYFLVTFEVNVYDFHVSVKAYCKQCSMVCWDSKFHPPQGVGNPGLTLWMKGHCYNVGLFKLCLKFSCDSGFLHLLPSTWEGKYRSMLQVYKVISGSDSLSTCSYLDMHASLAYEIIAKIWKGTSPGVTLKSLVPLNGMLVSGIVCLRGLVTPLRSTASDLPLTGSVMAEES